MTIVFTREVMTSSSHGFDCSRRNWAGDCTTYPREIAEAALSHGVGDESEQAYRHGSALEKHRGLMQAWSDYLLGAAGANVVALHARA